MTALMLNGESCTGPDIANLKSGLQLSIGGGGELEHTEKTSSMKMMLILYDSV